MRATAIVLGAAVAAIAVSACGGSSSSSSGGNSSSGSSSAATSAAASNSPAPKIFTIASSQEYNTLDPDLGLSEAQLQVMNLMAGTLVAFDPDGSHIAPSLASKWTISPNQKVYTFTLRPGLEFSDGRPLTPADIIASYNREMTDKASYNIGLTQTWKSWTSPNPQTVVLTLKVPDPDVISYLADPELGMVLPASDLKKGASYFNHPISDGRYEIQSFDPSTGNSVLVVNPHYPGPKPAVPEIKTTYVASATTRLIQLQNGQVDWAQDINPLELSQLKGASVGTLTPGYGGFYLDMNDHYGPLADVNVRKAISLAIDRQQLDTVMTGGHDTVMHGYMPPTMLGGQWGNIQPTAEVSQAKALLAGTPCAQGCTLPIMVRTDSAVYTPEAEVIQQNLKQIGITTPLQVTESSIANQKASKDQFALYTGGLYDYANRLDGYMSWGLTQAGGLNALYSGYKNPQMTALADKVIQVTGTERSDLLHQVVNLFDQDQPYVPLVAYPFTNGQQTDTSKWVIFEPTTFFSTPPS